MSVTTSSYLVALYKEQLENIDLDDDRSLAKWLKPKISDSFMKPGNPSHVAMHILASGLVSDHAKNHAERIVRMFSCDVSENSIIAMIVQSKACRELIHVTQKICAVKQKLPQDYLLLPTSGDYVYEKQFSTTAEAIDALFKENPFLKHILMYNPGKVFLAGSNSASLAFADSDNMVGFNNTSDFDIWFTGMASSADVYAAAKYISLLFQNVTVRHSRNVLTMKTDYHGRQLEFQIVYRNFDSITDCLRSFDLTCVGAALVCAMDGSGVLLATPEAVTGARIGIAYHYPNNMTQTSRFVKYASRGWLVHSRYSSGDINVKLYVVDDEVKLRIYFIPKNVHTEPSVNDISPREGAARVVARIQVIPPVAQNNYSIHQYQMAKLVKLHVGFTQFHCPENINAACEVPSVFSGKEACKRMVKP